MRELPQHLTLGSNIVTALNGFIKQHKLDHFRFKWFSKSLHGWSNGEYHFFDIGGDMVMLATDTEDLFVGPYLQSLEVFKLLQRAKMKAEVFTHQEPVKLNEFLPMGITRG